MTDCYICGHSILEGQRTQEFYVGQLKSHLNPADHLPTLGAPLRYQITTDTDGNDIVKPLNDTIPYSDRPNCQAIFDGRRCVLHQHDDSEHVWERADGATERRDERERAARMVEDFAEKEIGAAAAVVNIGRVRNLAARIRNGDE